MPSSNPGQFSNTWTPSLGPTTSHSLYDTPKGLNTNLGLGSITEEGAARASNTSMRLYAGVQVTCQIAQSGSRCHSCRSGIERRKYLCKATRTPHLKIFSFNTTPYSALYQLLYLKLGLFPQRFFLPIVLPSHT
jgi:hypothetical protein